MAYSNLGVLSLEKKIYNSTHIDSNQEMKEAYDNLSSSKKDYIVSW